MTKSKAIVGVLSAAVATLAPMAVSSKTSTIARAGVWEAFGGTTSKGGGICGMSTEVDQRYFGIKRVAESAIVSIQVGTSQWKLADGQKMAVRIVFDTNTPRDSSAVGMHFEDGDAGLEFYIEQAETENFLQEFRKSSRLLVQFPDGNFADWKLSLAGSTAVSDAYQQCLRKL
jgi:hypothetical protein